MIKGQNIRTPDEIEQMAKIYRSGIGATTIGRQFSVSPNTVMTYLKKAGVKIRVHNTNKMTPAKVKEMFKLYAEGWSVRQLQKKYGLAHPSIRHHFYKNNVPLRPKRPKKEDHWFYRGGWFHDHKAISQVNMAIKAGRLIRPDNCETCGMKNKKTKSGTSYIQAHHPDYNKPLDVMWLCKKCHHEWHEKFKAIPKRKPSILRRSK